MQYAIAVAALVAGVSASYPVANTTSAYETAPVYTTEVVTAYTTYCPAPTVITHGANTYTVSSATTLTITDCPCTISKPVYSTSAPPAGTAPVYPSAPAPYPTGNATVPAGPSAPVGTAPGSSPSVPAGESPSTPAEAPTTAAPSSPISTGAASRAFAPAGLAGLLGLAAYLL